MSAIVASTTENEAADLGVCAAAGTAAAMTRMTRPILRDMVFKANGCLETGSGETRRLPGRAQYPIEHVPHFTRVSDSNHTRERRFFAHRRSIRPAKNTAKRRAQAKTLMLARDASPPIQLNGAN